MIAMSAIFGSSDYIRVVVNPGVAYYAPSAQKLLPMYVGRHPKDAIPEHD